MSHSLLAGVLLCFTYGFGGDFTLLSFVLVAILALTAREIVRENWVLAKRGKEGRRKGGGKRKIKIVKSAMFLASLFFQSPLSS